MIVVKNNLISFPLSQSFEHTQQLSISIPSGFIRDEVNNYFCGSSDQEVIIHTGQFFSLSILQKMASSTYLIALLTLIAGIYTGVRGYRNLLNSMVLTNLASIIFILIAFACSVQFFSQFFTSNYMYIHCTAEAVVLVIACLISYWLTRISIITAWKGVVMVTFCLCGATIVRIVADIISLFTPLITMYVNDDNSQ